MTSRKILRRFPTNTVIALSQLAEEQENIYE